MRRVFVRGSEIEEVPTVHGEDLPVRKRVYCNRRENPIPHVMQFARSRSIGPVDTADGHVHKTMVEWYYVISGRATFHVGGWSMNAGPDDFIAVPPNTTHSYVVAAGDVLELFYGGIATEEKA